MKQISIKVVPASVNNFIITTAIPFGGAAMPLCMGYAMGANPHPFNTICGVLAFFVSMWMFRSIAVEWRDAKMANKALHIVIRQMQEEIDKRDVELAVAGVGLEPIDEKAPSGQEE